MGPAASNHTESTASPASTMSPMPSVSRANGERICVVGARWGFFLAGGFFAAGRFEGAFLLAGRLEARDVERRDGEVFVGIRASV